MAPRQLFMNGSFYLFHRTAAMKALNATGQGNINFESLYSVSPLKENQESGSKRHVWMYLCRFPLVASLSAFPLFFVPPSSLSPHLSGLSSLSLSIPSGLF